MACGNHEFNIEDCRDCWFISGIKHEFFSFEDVESFEGRRMLRDAAHGAIRSYKNTNEFAGITNFFKGYDFLEAKAKNPTLTRSMYEANIMEKQNAR